MELVRQKTKNEKRETRVVRRKRKGMGMRGRLGIACAVVALIVSACGSPGGELATQMMTPLPPASAAAAATHQPTPTELPTPMPTPTFISAATVTPEITYIYQQDLDLKGDIGSFFIVALTNSGNTYILNKKCMIYKKI